MKKLLLLPFLLLQLSWCAAQSPDAIVSVPEKRFMGAVEIGYLYGSAKHSDQNLTVASPTVQVFYGYRFGRLFSLGATTGMDFYDNMLVTPLALGMRGEAFDTRVSPTYSLDVGYGSAVLSEGGASSGGWMYNPALGLRVNTGNATAFTFGAGYKVQRVERESSSWGTITQQKINYRRLTLRLGFMF
jgi:hypothetical protein